MKLLHLSDIHLTSPGNTIGGRDPNANFTRALEHALRDHADADLLAITGDLSDWGDAEDYMRLRAALAEVPMPVRLCIGNHDSREAFLSVFPECRDGAGFAQHTAEIAGFRCLFLDSKAENSHAGGFCTMRRAWLSAELEAYSGPVLIFMHHNPMPTHLAPLDTIRLLDDVAFRTLVRQHADKIRHIFFGHCHLPFTGSVGGVPATSLRGTNHAGFPLYADATMLRGSDLPESYAVAFLKPDYSSIIMVEYGYAGEIRVEGSPDYATWDRASMVR